MAFTLKNSSISDTSTSSSDTNTNSTTTIKTRPTISGGSNESASGRAIPLILGKTYMTPYKLMEYNTIEGTDGENYKYHAMYLIGYNDIDVEDIALGIHKIANNDGVTEGVLPSENYDTSKAIAEKIDNGFIRLNYKTEDTIYDPSKHKTRIELRQDSNELEMFPQVVKQESRNVELPAVSDKDTFESRIRNCFSSKYPQKVEVEISFAGLCDLTSGTSKNTTCVIAMQISTDGGTTWKAPPSAFTGCSSYTVKNNAMYSTFTRSATKTIRFVCPITYTSFSEADAIKNHRLEIRLWKDTKTDTSKTGINNTVTLTSVRTWIYDNKESAKTTDDSLVALKPVAEKYRNKTARLGFEAIATDSNLSGTLDKLNLIATSKARTWDSTSKTWSKTTSKTENPASLALLALTKDCRGKYAYTIDDSGSYPTCNKIDLDSFGECYEECDKDKIFINSDGVTKTIMKQYACDGAVLSQTKTSDVVSSILSTCRASLILKGGKYAILQDVPRDYTVAILNNQNVIKATNEKDFEDLPDALQVKYVSAINDYQEDSIKVAPYGETITADSKIESVEYSYITNPFRAKAMAMYELACKKLRPETWSIKTSLDGYLIEIGDKIEYQSDTILVGIGNGAEITEVITNENYITGIKVDMPFTVDDVSKTYGIKIVQSDGINEPTVICKEVVISESGKYSELTFKDSISLDQTVLPTVGDIVSFGIYDRITTEGICFDKKDNGDGTFQLTVVPYAEGVYTADTTVVEDFNAKITPAQEPVSSDVATLEQLNEIKINSDTRSAELQSQIDGIEVNSVVIKSSRPSITFHKRPDDTSNYETYTVTFELYNNGTSVTPENCRVDISNITGNIVVTTSLTENIYTVKVETTYGSSSPSGFIRAYMDYNDESYTSNVTVTSEYSGSYIGAVTELPSSADLGSYFMWNSDTGDYNISCLYTLVQKINEDGTVYTEWVLDNDENHQMTALSDIMSVTDISKNTQTVALIERLVSNNAFIKNLFAEKIDITGNGYIESSNYVSGESGFKISADGNAEFQDGVFNGTVGQSITLATLTEDVTDEETYELDFSSLLDNTKVGSSVLTALTHETINTKSVLFNGIMTKGSDGIYINGNSSSKVVNRSIQKTELMHYPTFILNSLSAGDKIVLHYINIS